MPEIKHNFTGGKMNKDVDERLIPNGQYKDAMNIQVSTSEESDVGTVQNILGNVPGCSYTFSSGNKIGNNPIPINSKVIGSVSDEKNDTLYWLVAGNDGSPLSTYQPGDSLKDMIMRTNANHISGTSCEPVFVDTYAFVSGVSLVDPLTGAPVNDGNFDSLILDIENIQLGWSITGIDTNNDLSNTVQVTGFKDTDSVVTTIEVTSSMSNPIDYYGPETFGQQDLDSLSSSGVSGGATATTATVIDGIYLPLVYNTSTDQWVHTSTTSIYSTLANQVYIGTDNIINPNNLIGKEVNFFVDNEDGTFQLSNTAQLIGPGFTVYSPLPFLPSGTLIKTCALIPGTWSNPLLPPVTNGVTNTDPWPNFIYRLELWDGTNDVNFPDLNATTVDNWRAEDIANLFDPISYPSPDPIFAFGRLWQGKVIDMIVNRGPTVTNITNNIYNLSLPQDISNYVISPNQEVTLTSGETTLTGFASSSTLANPGVNGGSLTVVDANGNPLLFPPDSGDIIISFTTLTEVTFNQTLNLPAGGIQGGSFSWDRILIQKPRVLNFEQNNLVTGLNIVDDMLFWTDNNTEPKKINISRSVAGTESDGMTHTNFINYDRNITNTSNKVLAREEHITVIKKPPTQAPSLNMTAGRQGNLFGKISYNFDSEAVGNNISIEISTDNVEEELQYIVGDILILKQGVNNTDFNFPITDYDIRIKINEIIPPSIPNDPLTYYCEVLSISPGIIGSNEQPYGVDLDKSGEKLYSLKFPRFAIRYRYKDGEYSSYGPFSNVAFIPGEFNVDAESQYLPNKGYNLGMENTLTELELTNIIQGDIPDGVIQVDILYKESNSPNVYTVDEIKPSDTYWTSNSYQIKEETIKAVVPSNQLLRPFDNVPKKALAQDVTGNRIVYGNYEQNYSLENATRPKFKVKLKDRFDSFVKKSIKSLRKYQLGVVYCDQYNRQTPVLSDSSGSIRVDKIDSVKTSLLEVSTEHPHPSWATHYKFYIKETSTEYYNLSLDRHFEAKDGNIWLSFASNDRDKVDLETSLYLKKRFNSEDQETSNEKYKILDIKNEAPEYIQTRKVILGKVTDNNAGNRFFTNDDFLPGTNKESFRILQSGLDGTILEDFHKNQTATGSGGPVVKNPLYIKLSQVNAAGVKVGLETKWYEVDNVKKLELTGADEYEIRLKDKFEKFDDWIVRGAPSTSATTANLINLTGDSKGLVFEVAQDIVQNKAAFQGRFFAKILRDVNVEDAIVKQGTLGNVGVIAQVNAGYIKNYTTETPSPNGISANQITSHKTFVSTLITGFNNAGFTWPRWYKFIATQPSNIPATSGPPVGNPVNNDAYWSRLTWETISQQLDASVSSTNNGSRWVLDEAFSAGEDPLWNQNGGEYIDESADDDSYDASSGHYIYGGSSVFYGGVSFTPGYTNPLTIDQNKLSSIPWAPITKQDGLGHGSDSSQYEFYSTGRGVDTSLNTIDLSYIGPGRNESSDFSGGSTTYMNIYDNDWPMDNWKNLWSLSPSQGVFDEEAKNFADNLVGGKHIRFTNDGDGTIWKIKHVEIFNKWNYSDNKTDYQYPDGQPYYNRTNIQTLTNDQAKMNAHANWAYFNRRITYRLQLESIQLPNAKLGYNGYTPFITDGTTIDTNLCPIEIVELDYIKDTNDIPFPENPAIFETEPKEDVDLNIFHEASDTIPLALNINGSQFAPAGSEIRSLGFATKSGTLFGQINLETPYIGTIDGLGPRVLRWLGNGIVESTIRFYGANVGDTFTFTRSDGTYTVGRLVSLGNGDATSVQATIHAGTGNSIQASYFAKFEILNTVGLGWHNCFSFGNGVESNRVRDTFNSVFIDKGPKVSATLDDKYDLERRHYGLIYSGLYNSMSGINNLNQFIQAEKITKDINPNYGSIQKLHTRNSDLITLCEDKVLKILSNKDAVFNADGNTNLTATSKVLGQTIPFVGEYGISKNPESFASESYRAYFTDKVRGTVMRLSMDGLTPISEHGMKDWFRDHLKLSSELIGSYDDYKDEYNITLNMTSNADVDGRSDSKTVTFKESTKGWVSFKSFLPENGISCANKYYTYKNGHLYIHHDENQERNTFYGIFTATSVTAVLNSTPGSIKDFYTLNYEGSQGHMKTITSYSTFDRTSWNGVYGPNGEPVYTTVTDTIGAAEISGYNLQNLQAKNGWYVSKIETDKEEGSIKEFIEKEGKWFNYIKGKEWL